MRLVTGDDGKNGYLSHTRARSGAWRMILGTSVASSKGTGMMATLLMGLAARFHCRADPSDAALAPYHVEWSKLFVLDRVATVEELDGARIARAIDVCAAARLIAWYRARDYFLPCSSV
jgi:hypothetical protein